MDHIPVEPAMSTSSSTATARPVVENSTLEKLAIGYLQEQKSARRWRLFFRFGWFLLWVVIAIALFSRGNSGPDHRRLQHTAMIEIRGEIATGAEASAEFLTPALRDAFEDKSAKAVVLLIDSPGGSPVHAGIINDEIRRLKKLHQKPVYAVVQDSCASAAYYIAVSADKIYVDKASIVGSIGVLMDGFGFTGLMEKVGVERRLMTAGENKGFLDPFSPMSPEQRTYAQNLLDQIHRQFIAVVKQGRGNRLHETPELFTGLFWSGQQAVEMGLADQLGNLDYVAREVVQAEEIVDYTRRDNVAERLVKKFGAAIGSGAVRSMKAEAAALK